MASRAGAKFNEALRALEASVVSGPGHLAPAQRGAAAEGVHEDSPLGRYLAQVHTAAYRITDGEVAALRAHHSDDEVFEATVAAALGAAKVPLEAGLRAVAAAWDEEAP